MSVKRPFPPPDASRVSPYCTYQGDFPPTSSLCWISWRELVCVPRGQEASGAEQLRPRRYREHARSSAAPCSRETLGEPRALRPARSPGVPVSPVGATRDRDARATDSTGCFHAELPSEVRNLALEDLRGRERERYLRFGDSPVEDERKSYPRREDADPFHMDSAPVGATRPLGHGVRASRHCVHSSGAAGLALRDHFRRS